MTAKPTFFQDELRRLGPHQPPTAWTLEEAQAYCRRWARHQYENFSVASFLLPRRIRQDFYNVYTYCRWSDNLADEIGDTETSLELLNWWQGQLSLCYSGRPAHPVLLALQSTIQKYQLPIQPFTDLLSAFRQDQQVTRYADESQLLDYCSRSANPVGRILLMISGAATPTNLALGDQVCTGLQLANFCQDMSRDAGAGRIYAPRALWQRHEVTESDLLGGKVTTALRSMLAEWVPTTRNYFHRGWPLIERVPGWLATDVDLFVRGGLAILDRIEAAEFDVWTARPVVGKSLKLRLLCRSLTGRIFGRSSPGSTPCSRSTAADKTRNLALPSSTEPPPDGHLTDPHANHGKGGSPP